MMSTTGTEAIYAFSNAFLEGSYAVRERRLSVRDRRIGKCWCQEALDPRFSIDSVQVEDQCLFLTLSGPFPLRLAYRLEGPELLLTCGTGQDALLDSISLPAFQPPDKDHWQLQTDGEGLLLKVDDTGYPLGEFPLYFCGGGPAMAWGGLVDGNLDSGYMAIFETPFDMAVDYHRSEGLLAFSPVLLASMGMLGYERRIRYVFFDHGGYVAQCKRYRDFAWVRFDVETLREKQKRFPALSNMLGAVHIYVWDEARTPEFARQLKEAGIGKALILWDPNHVPYPPEGYDTALKEIGYATGGYELFTDIHPDDYPGNAMVRSAPLKRNVYPGGFDRLTARRKDGTTYCNEFGNYICPAAIRPDLIRRVERELALYPHETYFLDVYQANGLYECHHPEHPLTREGYAENILANCSLLEERFGLYLGGEFGSDFAAAKGCYVHGMMTLQRTWFNSEADRPGTIWYKGGWDSNPRPAIMLGARTASDTYLRYALNEKTRVPLYELVYHDAVVTSWRWEDGSHHCPEIWWKKDLFNILYGSAPLWSIDQERWHDFQASFVESFNRIHPCLEQICTDEMMNHRFITADGMVQESVFSSGKRVIVNFGDEPVQYDGHFIGRRDFVTC